MKTLIINGSPRKNGFTAALTGRLRELLNGDVDIVETYRAKVSPCMDCRYCWTHPNCVLQDAMQDIYTKIEAADNIVIASPINFAELTGSLLSWASRLQLYWVAKYIRNEDLWSGKNKYGAVILVDGGGGLKDIALGTAKRLLREMGAKFKDFVYFSGTDENDPLSDETTLNGLDNIAAVLNSAVR